MARVSIFVLAGLLGGCASRAQPVRAPVAPSAPAISVAEMPAAEAPLPSSCPPPETRLGAEDTTHGAALVLTTSRGLADLRSQAAVLTLSNAPASEARLDNIRRGVRVVFETTRESDVGELRRRVAERARGIADECGVVLAPPSELRPPRQPSVQAETKHPAVETPKLHSPANKAAEKKGVKDAHHPAPKPAAPIKPKPPSTAPHPATPLPPTAKPLPRQKPRAPVLPGAPPSPLEPRAIRPRARLW